MLDELEQSLHQYGLRLRGVTPLGEEEKKQYALTGNSVALVGNVGSSYWAEFSNSPEFSDGEDNPLDRWSKRIAKTIVDSFDSKHTITAVFPSDGPPWLPFLQWAKKAQPIFHSPLGITIHSEYGLWHSYRFALILPVENQTHFKTVESACDSCLDKPCLNTCPVSAFTTEGFDFEACARYLHENNDADCLSYGCEARNSCPVGTEFRYNDEQHCFHLNAFLKAHPA